MATINAVIFDLDGVLTNTAEMHYRSWKRVADDEGIPFDRIRNADLRGVTREESLRRLLNGRVVSPQTFASMMSRKNEFYVAQIATLGPRDLAPGAAGLMAELKAIGVRLALASASRNAQQVVDRLAIRGWFHAIVDGACAARPKPAADLFLHSARMLDVTARECLVIEDSASGLHAARAAGMRTAAFGEDVAGEPADMYLPSFVGVNALTLLAGCAERPPVRGLVDVFAGAEVGTV